MGTYVAEPWDTQRIIEKPVCVLCRCVCMGACGVGEWGG